MASIAIGRRVPKTRARGIQKWYQPRGRNVSVREHRKFVRLNLAGKLAAAPPETGGQ